MTAPRPAASQRARAYRTLAGIALAMVAAAGVWFSLRLIPPKPGHVEKIREDLLPANLLNSSNVNTGQKPLAFAVRDGQLILVRAPDREVIASVTPMAGGRERVFYHASLERLRISVQAITGTDILLTEIPLPTYHAPGAPEQKGYLFENNPDTGISGFSDAVARPAYTTPFAFPDSLPPPAPGEQRRVMPIPAASSAERLENVVVRRISLSGVTQAFPVRADPGYTLFTPDALFWKKQEGGKQITVQPAKGNGYILDALSSELYARSLDGGDVRRIATGLPGTVFPLIHPNGKGLIYYLPHKYHDPVHDLYLHADLNASPLILKNYRGLRFPILVEGRLLWLEPGASSLENSHPALHLISVREDGSDRQERSINSPGNAEGFSDALLRTDGVHLYLLYGVGPMIVSPLDVRDHFVSRLHTDTGEILGPPCRISQMASSAATEAHLNSGWLYYLEVEYRKTPLDFLSENSTEKRLVNLYRVRLPD